MGCAPRDKGTSEAGAGPFLWQCLRPGERVVQGTDTADGDDAQRDPDVSMRMGWDGLDRIQIGTGAVSVIDLGRYRWYGVLDRGRESVPST